MSISSVNSQRPNPYSIAQLRIENSGAVDASAKSSSTSSVTTSTSTDSVNLQTDAKSIMAKYDLTHITYNDMEKLGRELVAAGALPENKLLDFIPIDLSRIKLDGTVGEPSNQPVNMIANQEQIIENQRRFGKGAEYSTVVLNIYKNFQALHDQVSTQAMAQLPVDDLQNEAKYNVPEMKQGVFYNVDKWIDTHMSAEDKQVLGFPLAQGKGSLENDALRQLGLAILDKRNLGFLKGPLTKQYLTDEGPYGVGNVKKWTQFQSAAGQKTLNEIFSRAS